MTPDDVEREHTLATATARFDELRLRDALAPHAGTHPAPDGGTGDGEGHGTPALTRQEALELLALGEVIARKAAYGRQLTVRSARAAGASWAQIGAALGTSKQSAWETHARWLDAQVDA